ncbi:MAG: hypothetical protein AAGK04_10230, partial [Planctomycetota bacterium]
MSLTEELRPYLAPAAIVAAVIGGVQFGLLAPELARLQKAEASLESVQSQEERPERSVLYNEASIARIAARIEAHQPWLERAGGELPEPGSLFRRAGNLAETHGAQLRKFSPSDIIAAAEGVVARDVQLELSGSLECVRDVLHAYET